MVVEGGVEQWVEGVVPGEAGWHSCQPSHQLRLPYFSSPLTPEEKAVWYVWVGEGSWKALCTWITVNKNSFLPSARSFLPQGYFLLCHYLQCSVCILVHLIMYILVESMCLSYVVFCCFSIPVPSLCVLYPWLSGFPISLSQVILVFPFSYVSFACHCAFSPLPALLIIPLLVPFCIPIRFPCLCLFLSLCQIRLCGPVIYYFLLYFGGCLSLVFSI